MDIRERLIEVRKAQKLNQAAFGERIGVSRSAVCNYENGTRPIGNQVVRSVCREFNISEDWLRYGVGEMDSEEPTEVLDQLIKLYDMNNFEATFLDAYLKMPKAERQSFCRFLVTLFGGSMGSLSEYDLDALAPNFPSGSKPLSEMSRDELHAELDRQLDLEKKAEGGS